jgi:hypothetical protein
MTHPAETPCSQATYPRASIANDVIAPGRLTPALQMDVCAQCHLEPTSGDLPSLIRRFDRAIFFYARRTAREL